MDILPVDLLPVAVALLRQVQVVLHIAKEVGYSLEEAAVVVHHTVLLVLLLLVEVPVVVALQAGEEVLHVALLVDCLRSLAVVRYCFLSFQVQSFVGARSGQPD